MPWNGTKKEQQAILKDFDKAQAWARKAPSPDLLGRVRRVRQGGHGRARPLDELCDTPSGKTGVELGLVAV